jgi:hypothetical protein
MILVFGIGIEIGIGLDWGGRGEWGVGGLVVGVFKIAWKSRIH